MEIREKGHSREGTLELRAEGEEKIEPDCFIYSGNHRCLAVLSGKDCG